VNTCSYSDLIRMPVVRRFEEAFRGAMGVPVRLFPPEIPTKRLSLGVFENPLCTFVGASTQVCQCCVACQSRVLRGVSKHLVLQQVSCAAGLTEVAVPVVVGLRHVATLLSGQVLRREPTERDFELLVQTLGGASAGPSWHKAIKAAYFSTPVLTADRFNAMNRMLELFAGFIAETVGSESVTATEVEPESVVSAKKIIQEHMSESLDLPSMVRHLGLSRSYFCRLFKRSTGMTLSDYAARVRMEKAKVMLINPSVRIAEIGYSVGFRSIPRFNGAFKQHVGMTPSDYRDALLFKVACGPGPLLRG